VSHPNAATQAIDDIQAVIDKVPSRRRPSDIRFGSSFKKRSLQHIMESVPVPGFAAGAKSPRAHLGRGGRDIRDASKKTRILMRAMLLRVI
jgi:hypothetical protein